MIKFQDIKFPLKLEQGETLHPLAARHIIRDNIDQRVGVLYDMDIETARAIITTLNRFNPEIEASKIASMAGTEIEEASFPSWMGMYPRYGAQWSAQEKAVLKSRWLEGMTLYHIAAAHGRDASSIVNNLEKMLGANYLQFQGANQKRVARFARITELGDELLKLMSEEAMISNSDEIGTMF